MTSSDGLKSIVTCNGSKIRIEVNIMIGDLTQTKLEGF